MDKVGSIIRNLVYQKENFPNIYSCYLENNLQEVAITTLDNYDVNKHNKIVILCEDYNEFLEEIFYIQNQEQLNRYKSIFIQKSYAIDESYEKEGILYISINHQYTLNGMEIELIKKLKKDNLNNASALFSMKKFNLFDKKIVKELDVAVFEISSYEVLKEKLMLYKPTYREGEFIKRNLFIEEKVEMIDQTSFYETFKVSLSIEYIKAFAQDFDNHIKVMNKMEASYNREFFKLANKLLVKNLNDKFKDNYYKVEFLLSEFDVFKKKFIVEEKRFMKSLKNINIDSTESDKYLYISNSNIAQFDQIISSSLEVFMKRLLSFNLERC